MADPRDIDLVREYADRNSEPAFAELVRRHINLVYSVALRFTGHPQDAEDVTQAVFVILAQKACGLRAKTILTGWLYETTRFTAKRFLRTQVSRQLREQKAYMSTITDSNSESVWRQLAPLLEEAMARLSEKERTLVAFRFFENRSAAETAALLGIKEWATRKRVERAVEKLRLFFMKRGVVVPAAAITTAISANSVQAAPVALAKTATAIAIAKSATATGSTLTLVKGALKFMAWSKAKTAIIVGVGILLATGTATSVAYKKKMEAVEAYRGKAWQQQYDASIVDRLPPQVAIFPALRSRPVAVSSWGGDNGKFVGLGVGVNDIMQAAYGVSSGRLIYSSPVPIGRYDFIQNLKTNQQEALQQAVKKKFGLVGKRQLIETNVLVLTAPFRTASGLRPASGEDSFNVENGSLSARNKPINQLIFALEYFLRIPIVDQTGLQGNFDLDLKWDSTPDGLKQAVRQQLGLELVAGRDTINFVVVGKEK
jgi:uncharacterized protein (TIGR03435 family)